MVVQRTPLECILCVDHLPMCCNIKRFYSDISFLDFLFNIFFVQSFIKPDDTNTRSRRSLPFKSYVLCSGGKPADRASPLHEQARLLRGNNLYCNQPTVLREPLVVMECRLLCHLRGIPSDTSIIKRYSGMYSPDPFGL